MRLSVRGAVSYLILIISLNLSFSIDNFTKNVIKLNKKGAEV